MRARRGAFEIALVAVTALGTLFIGVPVIALFLRTSPAELLGALGEPAAIEALSLSIRTSVIAHAIILAFGTPLAYALATRRFRGRSVIITLIDLPIVLPPAVAGLALLAAFGRLGLLGETLDLFGVRLAFTTAAVVVAIVFVAGPYYVRQAIAAFGSVDPEMVAAARTLGAGPARTFARISVPLAARGLAAGSALAWARGLGEFGATIMFAGSFAGVTRTLPLAIYAEFDRDIDIALALGALLVAFSATILIAVRALSWRRSSSTSPSAAEPSMSF